MGDYEVTEAKATLYLELMLTPKESLKQADFELFKRLHMDEDIIRIFNKHNEEIEDREPEIAI